MSSLRVINIEAEFPSLDEARRAVQQEIRRARQDKIRVLKIIHGYGSSGKGGTLNFGLRKSFQLRKKEGAIKDFIPGEDFSIFDRRTLDAIGAFPELRADPDLNTTNEGVTFVLL